MSTTAQYGWKTAGRLLAALTSAALIAGCSANSGGFAPLVTKLETQQVGPAPASAHALADLKAETALAAGEGPTAASSATTPSASPEVVAHVTLKKASLLNRVFLYGSDLQYSSITDGGMSLIIQAQSTGHTPVYFRIIDNRLQMLADQHDQFESDVNHPERLIHEFTILSQDADQVTIELAKGSPVLNTVVDPKAKPIRTSWVRSVNYVDQGQYLMFETSIEMQDGQIAEFMETFFPRDTIVPSDAKAVYNDAALEPNAARYRFLDAGDVWLDVDGKGRVKTKVANRYLLKPGQTIDWYVTPNVPDTYLPQIKSAIEGWNRYSQKATGTDMIRFIGKLPDGVKLGDPRYNVVNWDSVAQAGAAYESQAADPYTGVQSHALVYLPKAWVNIGVDYWNAGEPSETAQAKTQALMKAVTRGNFLGQRLPVNCVKDVSAEMSLDARYNPDQFSRELLKGVLFHEVGHALGLAHNFKGSLSFDADDAKSAMSTSIMDYNQYQLERVAFDTITSTTGPLLEYDRQVISVLYNGGKDVSASDAVVPACADDESDSMDGGVDPLCIRYDAGHDPTQELSRVIGLVKDQSSVIRDEKSLAVAVKQLSSSLGDASSVKTQDDATKAVEKLVKQLAGTITYYYSGGAQSISYMARANIRSLRQWKDGILPDGYDEMAMRARAIDGIRYVVSVETLEAPVKTEVGAYLDVVRSWLKTTPFIQSISADKQADTLAALTASFTGLPAKLDSVVLSKMRTSFFKDLTASEKAPFFFVDDGVHSVDFEREAAQLLSRAATQPLSSGSMRPVAERVAAATALKTFSSTTMGASFVQDATTALTNEAKAARTLTARTEAVAVLKALTATDDKPSDD